MNVVSRYKRVFCIIHVVTEDWSSHQELQKLFVIASTAVGWCRRNCFVGESPGASRWCYVSAFRILPSNRDRGFRKDGTQTRIRELGIAKLFREYLWICCLDCQIANVVAKVYHYNE